MLRRPLHPILFVFATLFLFDFVRANEDVVKPLPLHPDLHHGKTDRFRPVTIPQPVHPGDVNRISEKLHTFAPPPFNDHPHNGGVINPDLPPIIHIEDKDKAIHEKRTRAPFVPRGHRLSTERPIITA